jgi:hypothetical protein
LLTPEQSLAMIGSGAWTELPTQDTHYGAKPKPIRLRKPRLIVNEKRTMREKTFYFQTEFQMADTILYNIHGEKFYDSRTHIKDDTRVKTRCSHYLWQYRDKDDKDGARFGACIGMDLEELRDLQKRGVKFYRCNYPSGSYTVPLEKIFEWGVAVVNRPGDREQIAVSIRHWKFELKGKKKERKMKVIVAKPKKRQKEWLQRSFV